MVRTGKGKLILTIVAALIFLWGAGRIVLISNDQPRPNTTPLGPYDADMDLRAAFESLPGPTEPQDLVLLQDNVDAWVARWRMLDQARHHIDINYFILKPDIFGLAFLGHLLVKSQQGVRVRLLLDAMGTAMSRQTRGNDLLQAVVAAGNIEVKMFRPLRNRYLEAVLRLSPVPVIASNHDKILVVDGNTGLVGGRNISMEYFTHPADNVRAFHDLDLQVTGRQAVVYLERAFAVQYNSDDAKALSEDADDWASYSQRLIGAYRAMDAWLKGEIPEPPWRETLEGLPTLKGAAARPPPKVEHAEVRFVDSHTRLFRGCDPVSLGLARLAMSTRRELLLFSPYIVLSNQAVELLGDVGRKGVKITMLTNSASSTDDRISQAFLLEQWPELLAWVPNLRLYGMGGLRNAHAKSAVFDGQVATIGTFNLDPLSMTMNSEISAVVWSREVATTIADEGASVIAMGPPTVYRYSIRRDEDGRPRRDDDGEVIPIFGPQDHTKPDAWPILKLYIRLIHLARPFFNTPFLSTSC